MNLASLADMTRKLAFRLTLASARRNSEVWAFSADVRFGLELPVKHRPSGLPASCRSCQNCLAKERQIRVSQHLNLVQVSAVCLYRRHTDYISKQTVSGWISHLITQGLLGGLG